MPFILHSMPRQAAVHLEVELSTPDVQHPDPATFPEMGTLMTWEPLPFLTAIQHLSCRPQTPLAFHGAPSNQAPCYQPPSLQPQAPQQQPFSEALVQLSRVSPP